MVAKRQQTAAGAQGVVGPALGTREESPGAWEEAPAEDPIRRETAGRLAEILGVAGHEMKTPLTVVQLSLQRVLRQLSRSLHPDAERPEPARALERTWEMLQLMEYEIKRLGHFVDGLLDVSRVETGKLDFVAERCDLVTLVGAAVAEQRLIWPARRIVYDAATGATAPVLADPRRIGQVVANYLTNALKFSPADRPVEVWVEIGATEARICVRDHGPGLPAAEKERVWERFQQVDGGAPRGGAGGGLGLGLYISRSIAEQCHGEVGLESAPGAGATFWFRLPLADGGWVAPAGGVEGREAPCTARPTGPGREGTARPMRPVHRRAACPRASGIVPPGGVRSDESARRDSEAPGDVSASSRGGRSGRS